MCISTVRGLSRSSRAMALSVRPRATRSSTSSWRRVSQATAPLRDGRVPRSPTASPRPSSVRAAFRASRTALRPRAARMLVERRLALPQGRQNLTGAQPRGRLLEGRVGVVQEPSGDPELIRGGLRLALEPREFPQGVCQRRERDRPAVPVGGAAQDASDAAGPPPRPARRKSIMNARFSSPSLCGRIAGLLAEGRGEGWQGPACPAAQIQRRVLGRTNWPPAAMPVHPHPASSLQGEELFWRLIPISSLV